MHARWNFRAWPPHSCRPLHNNALEVAWHVLYFKLATYFEKAALRVTTAMGAAPPACAVGVAALNFTGPVELLRLVITTYLPSDHP